MKFYDTNLIAKIQHTIDIFEMLFRDGNSGRYKGKKKEAIVRLREDLSCAIKVWPKIIEVFEDDHFMRDRNDYPLLTYQSVRIGSIGHIYHKGIDHSSTEEFINNLANELVTGKLFYIKSYSRLAENLQRVLSNVCKKISEQVYWVMRKLNQRELGILQALLEEKAFDEPSLLTTEETAIIVDGNFVNPEVFKTPVSVLAKMDLIYSITGRHGGIWLSQMGKNIAIVFKYSP